MSSTGYEVTVETLHSEATHWEAQGAALGTIPAAVSGLKFDRLQSGLFQLVTSANNTVVDTVSDRAAEGNAEMANIAQGLRVTARAYEGQEHYAAHDFNRV